MTEFLQSIYKWYLLNRRDLPWRQSNDPYKIWISEIILQQTQVKQGLGYYNRFISQFPTLAVLADSTEDEVLKAWQGLGYYSRARNLYYSAGLIAEKYKGKFPENFDDIISLKGIGDYTAAAIASIAFNLPFAAVDGNIARFLARYFEIKELVNSTPGKKRINEIANEILNHKNPGLHNEALMELGALICKPTNPLCHFCPVHETCLAFINHSVHLLPEKKKPLPQKNRYFFYFLIEENETVYLQKRLANDIWKNLYELPLIETDVKMSAEEVLSSETFKTVFGRQEFHVLKITGPIIHVLSHQKINTSFIHLRITGENKLTNQALQINRKDIPKFAIPRLIENFLVESGIIFKLKVGKGQG